MTSEARAELLTRAYELFNARRVDELLVTMTDDVEWPNVAAGTTLTGRDEIRAYWLEQLSRSSPNVTLVGLADAGDDVVAEVDQVVLDLEGNTIRPRTTVFHRYTFRGDLVCRMRVFSDRDDATGPS